MERAETGLLRADRGGHPTEPVRPLVVQARESSPFTRKCRRITGASRHESTPSRPCTVARVVKNRTKRSDEAIARRRRSARMARMCRIDGIRSVAEMVQNPLDDCGLLNAGDHPQSPAALSAGLNVDSEHPLEALCP